MTAWALWATLFIFSTASVAADGGCRELVSKELKHLNSMVESYPFRVWYATKGKHAINNPELAFSLSGNPDFIDDLILQLHAADKYFSKELGLTPPLSQPRYSQAEFIDVHVVAMDRGNGVAFDEVIAEKISKGTESYSCSIKMHINKELDLSRNVTPAHELFHLYQYSNSMFKVGWYLEGMARWVEQAFVGPSANYLNSRPVSSCSEVYLESYSASRYWQELARIKKADDIFLPQEYLELRYTNGQPVFKTDTFKSGSILKSIFKRLEKESLQLSDKINLPAYQWPEKIQRSAMFNENICRAVESIELF